MKSIALVPAIALALALAPDRPATQQRDKDLSDFTTRVEAYVTLHRQIERTVPQQEIFTNPEEGHRAATELAQALRAVRPHAREGDIFSPVAAMKLRNVIRKALSVNDVSAAALLERNRADTDETAPAPMVNEAFSWTLANAMPPFMLQALPDLPDELQYQFVGRDLVLIDIHANLVVDILRDALS